MTYQTYLTAIQNFIVGNWDRFVDLLSENHSKAVESPSRIDIVSEKHGSDYHPARIVVSGVDAIKSFVVNVAVNERGRSRLIQDFRTMQLLRSKYTRPFVPHVYFSGAVSVQGPHKVDDNISLFLGEWLDGFYEFHLSLDETDGSTSIVVWDLDKGYSILSPSESDDIFREVAFILTYYYDTETFEEVFPWHHAAGDFVVARSEDDVRVKLVTARQYAPRLNFEEQSPGNQMESLILFIANLTVRMRLDRLDGVGEIVWAGENCVESTMNGVLNALRAKIDEGRCNSTLIHSFVGLAKQMSPEDVAAIFMQVAESYDESAPDLPVIRENLVDHILQVYRVFQGLSAATVGS
jgi:hypothetical protein